MLRIGEFSKLSHLTIKALRFYEREDLLIPENVDEWTGYRVYDTSQLKDAAIIKSFDFKKEYKEFYMPKNKPEIRSLIIMIDWKRIPKIDAHIHLMPPDVIESNKGYNDKFVDFGEVDDYVKIMDDYNIEAAFIMPFNDSYMLSMDYKVESVQKNMINMCKRAENRLYCFADIDIRNELSTTIDALGKALKHEECLGVKIHSTNTGYPIDGEYYEGIFEWANKNDVLIEIHSYPRTHLLDDVCSPSRIKRIIAKYPNLRISIAHMGGFQYEELINLGVYINISAILPDLTDKIGIEKTNEILRLLDIEKLIFATDYPDSRNLKPKEIYDKYFEILGKMDFTLEEAVRICKYNAIKMIKKN